MAKKLILTGDPTDHGGVVISGSPIAQIGGRAIARIGDEVSCPLLYPDNSPHGVNKIVDGSANFLIDGIPAAVEGSKSECGCTLIGTIPATVD